jgi:hypothetical protein
MKQNKDRNGKTMKLDDMVLLPSGKIGTVIDVASYGVTVEALVSKQTFVYGSWELSLIAKHMKTVEI